MTTHSSHYSIFKTDYNQFGKTILVCGGAHDSEQECRIHWQSYLYGFMDSAFELLGHDNFCLEQGDRPLFFRFVCMNGQKNVQYFMLLNEEADQLIKEINY